LIQELGDLSDVLKLKFQVLNHLAKPLLRQRIDRPHYQSTGLGQLPFQFFSIPVIHFSAPAN
jgi:hypothetical protein